MPRRLTTEEFIRKARKVHGEKYSYDRTTYVRNSDKITITCPEHGDFEQVANSHLSGVSCSRCAGNRKYTTDEFVERAMVVHSGKYTYCRTHYAGVNKKVIITCPKHGDFKQTSGHHLQGRGCLRCGIESLSSLNTLTTEEFIEKVRKVHGYRFDYSQVVYTSAHDKVVIICPEHGDFEQIPNVHLSGAGCARCSRVHRPTTEEFIEKARKIHGDKYDYGLVVYERAGDKVSITCPTHGVFKQRPNRHLQGDGCPACALYGFNPSVRSFLYFLIDTETYTRIKIGVSNLPEQRFTQLARRTPFNIERLDLFETPSEITLQIEKFCHSQLDSANLSGFDGATEWFKFDGGRLESLREFIKSCGGVTR